MTQPSPTNKTPPPSDAAVPGSHQLPNHSSSPSKTILHALSRLASPPISLLHKNDVSVIHIPGACRFELGHHCYQYIFRTFEPVMEAYWENRRQSSRPKQQHQQQHSFFSSSEPLLLCFVGPQVWVPDGTLLIFRREHEPLLQDQEHHYVAMLFSDSLYDEWEPKVHSIHQFVIRKDPEHSGGGSSLIELSHQQREEEALGEDEEESYSDSNEQRQEGSCTSDTNLSHSNTTSPPAQQNSIEDSTQGKLLHTPTTEENHQSSLIQSILQRSQHPHAVFLFQPGFWGYSSWKDSVQRMLQYKPTTPIISTGYNLHECEDDEDQLLEFGVKKWIWESEENPHRSSQIRKSSMEGGLDLQENHSWQCWVPE